MSKNQHQQPGRDNKNQINRSPELKTPTATARKQAAAQRRAQQINMGRHKGVVTKVASCNARFYLPLKSNERAMPPGNVPKLRGAWSFPAPLFLELGRKPHPGECNYTHPEVTSHQRIMMHRGARP